MADPQKPKYGKPYCWECRGHTKFKVVNYTIQTEHGSRDRKKNICRNCGKIMKAPRDMDSAYYGPWAIVGLSVYFPLTIAAILWLALDGENWLDENGNHEEGWIPIFFASIVALFCLVLPAVILVLAAKKYATWKQWAIERGWQEPPRKERAWKKGDS